MRRPRRASAVTACASLVAVLLPAAAASATPDGGQATEDGEATSAATATRHFRFGLRTRGQVETDPEAFAAAADAVLNHRRGWSLGGSVAFDRVADEADFDLILASPQAVADAAPECSAAYSCRVGDAIYVNDRNWRQATSAWRDADGDLRTYRRYLITHEVGHWLGSGHAECPGADQSAPVMQQQSISLDGCVPSGWPRSSERRGLADRLDVPLLPVHTSVAGDPAGEGRDDVPGDDTDDGTRDDTGDGTDVIARYQPRTWWASASSGDGVGSSWWNPFGRGGGWQTNLIGGVAGGAPFDLISDHPTNGTWWASLRDGTSFAAREWGRTR